MLDQIQLAWMEGAPGSRSGQKTWPDNVSPVSDREHLFSGCDRCEQGAGTLRERMLSFSCSTDSKGEKKSPESNVHLAVRVWKSSCRFHAC